MTDRPPPNPAVGTVYGGYVWDGRQWVPQMDGAGRVFDGFQWGPPPRATRPTAANPIWTNQSAGGFASSSHAYGLTRQTSDDLQFIARFTKIMIWVWIIQLVLSIGLMIFIWSQLVALLALLNALLPR